MTRIHLDHGDNDVPPWVAPAVVAAVLAFMVGFLVELSRR